MKSGTRTTAANSRAPSKHNIDARNPQFPGGLTDRNVRHYPTKDDYKELKDLILAARVVKTTAEEEERWDEDLAKCSASGEAVFQRTIMMDFIDRHRLGDELDYICESTWCCARMPRREREGMVPMCLPTPDLSVAFKTDLLIPLDSEFVLQKFKGQMFPDAQTEVEQVRAFPFLSVEIGSTQARQVHTTGDRQNLNTASQALHNIYMIMKEAGHAQKFFDKVRVFSIAATAMTFRVRVHRAYRVASQHFIRPDYPLAFAFEEIFTMPLKSYSKANVLKTVKNILFDYGVKILHPILKDALKDLVEKEGEKNITQALTGKRRAEEDLMSSSSKRQGGDLNNRIAPSNQE
ncbi:MAG: hypothetical protein M1837_001179 [Sclerophora amabilis]|nr:MAG: hypothetical protein M1837_001179 [Sclerophora amabilis]